MGGDHRLHRRGPRLAGGDLGLEVGDIVRGGPRRPGSGGQGGQGLGLQKAPPPHDRQGVQHHPLLIDGGGERRHRARLHPAHVGMVAARRDVEGWLAFLAQEDRHHDGDVRQVGAAGIRVVEGEGVAGMQLRMPVADGPHAGPHRAQVHRHVRGVGHQPALDVEQRAGEIQPLLDVHRPRRPLQRRPHGLGHAHEAPVEQLQRDGVRRLQRLDDGGGWRRGTDQTDQALGVGVGGPAGRHGNLGVATHDQRGAGEGGGERIRLH